MVGVLEWVLSEVLPGEFLNLRILLFGIESHWGLCSRHETQEFRCKTSGLGFRVNPQNFEILPKYHARICLDGKSESFTQSLGSKQKTVWRMLRIRSARQDVV